MNFQEELETLVAARYPIIYVLSSEETRVQQIAAQLAASRGKKLFEWSCVTGMTPAGSSIQSQKFRQSSGKDPLIALDQVIDLVDPAIFLFKDLHPFLTAQRPEVTRKLKEIALQLKNSRKTILIVSPVLQVPPELEKELTILSLPLPAKLELGQLLDSIAEDLRGEGQALIDASPASREKLLGAALGLTLTEAENVFARMIVQNRRLAGEDISAVLEEKRQIIKKSGVLEYYSSEDTFENIGGLTTLKEWLRKRAAAFSDEARSFGLPPPRGILLLGVQGCGKSLCARAIAQQWRLPLLRFDIGRMFGSMLGSSEENTRKAISVCESIAPVILWIDEIDKAFSGTRGSGASDGGTTARVLGTLLTWLSEKTAPVFVVATANDISLLPSELMRKGRLDDIFFVDLPEAAERRDIFRIHLERRGQPVASFDLAPLAELSNGFSGAEIEQAVISALYDAFDARLPLSDAHLRQSLEATVPLSRTMAEEISSLRSWASARARPANG
jgi:SpoVK/Ycf46/Vps4 family AAA+-type ATPase